MKNSTLVIRAILMTALFAGVTAYAAEGRKIVPPNPGAAAGTGQPLAGVQVRPLKDQIRLNAGASRGIGKPLMVQVSYDKLNQKFTEFSGQAKKYESDAKTMPEIAKQCAAKAYSVQDQKAAGCSGNDTLNQCMDKLYKHCVETYSVSGINLSTGGVDPVTGSQSSYQTPGFSTKQFQQTAHAASASARVLSQLLNQYANEVDQNAKALVP